MCYTDITSLYKIDLTATWTPTFKGSSLFISKISEADSA